MCTCPCVSLPTTVIVCTLEHGNAVTSTGYTTRSLRGYWVGAAGRPAGLPPNHRSLSPLLYSPLPESFHLREHGGSLYPVLPGILSFLSLSFSLLRGLLSFLLPHRTSRLYTRSPALPFSLSHSIANPPRICARACASGRAHRWLCARRANISRALCSLLPFYEALHDDVHLCPPCQDAGPG